MKKNLTFFEELAQMQADGASGTLCILTRVEGSAPQITGAKMIVKRTGELVGTVGGGALEKRLIDLSKEVLNEGKPRTVSFNLVKDLGMACGGQAEAYLEPFAGQDRLVIFGGGHIAQPMSEIGRMLGYQITVVDDRAEWANRERFPAADQVVVSSIEAFLSQQKFGSQDHILIVTRGHEYDQKCLESVIQGDFAWLGMIGSKRKVAQSFQRLRELGISEEKIARIEAPVGLDLGAVSPEEIAVSIAARLVDLRRNPSRHETHLQSHLPLMRKQ